jgi:hypothetical protein
MRVFWIFLFGLTVAASATDSARAQASICTTDVIPVCAVKKDGSRQTYSNACWAKLDHARVLHPGMCLGPICIFNLNPVCAIDPVKGYPRTYPSLCAAETANARWVRDGTCR